ncbi:hypothetical protein PV11_03520 [Exophiala sideris]|uniref:Uncharacterized protein n=1 Tax=Exophiala sideris TaxID=1016849 RepID=A0A0D1YJZ2_9EURO|nr:hypothetical protein PV11_03520 [Exophiala sideris]
MSFLSRLPVSNVRGLTARSLGNHLQPGSFSKCLASRRNNYSVIGETTVDQTKQSNDPSNSKKDAHQAQATKPGSAEGRSHPAKQPDPQQSPSKSTGFETEGPGSKAGAGADKGVSKDRGAGPHMKQ